MKRKLVFLVVVILAALLVWRCRQRNKTRVEQFDGRVPTVSSEGSSETRKPAQVLSQSIESTQSNGVAKNDASLPATVEKPQYELAETKSSFDPVADAKRREHLPFQMFASGGLGKIVDATGNVVVQSDAKSGIFGCEVSPNQKRIVVYRGDADYDVITPSTGETIRLPQQPQGENKLGLSSFHWIDDDTLIAESGDVRLDATGRPRCSDDNVIRTRLYLYSISHRKLSEIELIADTGRKLFSIAEVSPTGYVHLIDEDPNASSSTDLGWFKVRPK